MWLVTWSSVSYNSFSSVSGENRPTPYSIPKSSLYTRTSTALFPAEAPGPTAYYKQVNALPQCKITLCQHLQVSSSASLHCAHILLCVSSSAILLPLLSHLSGPIVSKCLESFQDWSPSIICPSHSLWHQVGVIEGIVSSSRPTLW